MMLWDPLNAWPRGRRWLWASLAVLVCLLQGPGFVESLRPSLDDGVDFFQEWASGRNYLSGVPIYTNQEVAVQRYLGFQVGPASRQSPSQGETRVGVAIPVNAHPPSSVLLTLPLALLSYPDAVLVWNLISLTALLASLWLVVWQLRIPLSRWSIFPLIALLLLCSPLRQQVSQGQLNLVLLLLLTGAWAAQRSLKWGWAGTLVGTAAAIKLFPGFLFLYFALRRQWKAVAAGVLSLLVLSGVTAAVLGADAYESYGREVLTSVASYQSGWINASLPGLWTKLFDPATEQEHVSPLWRSPALARAGAWLSRGLVVLLLAPAVWRARTQAKTDRAFAVTTIAMLLVSPITWDHYFLLLLVPLAVLWTQLPPGNLARVSFLTIVAMLWIEPVRLYDHLIPGGHQHGMASPAATLSVLSLHCYALLGLFVLTLAAKRGVATGKEDPSRLEHGARECPCLS
jgi:hypothetical protein